MTAHFQEGGEHFYSRVKIKCQNLFTFIKCSFSIRYSNQYLIGGEETENNFYANLGKARKAEGKKVRESGREHFQSSSLQILTEQTRNVRTALKA